MNIGDNAESLVDLQHSSDFWRRLSRAQDSLIKYGLTAMTDAVIADKILILDSLQGRDFISFNAMISNTKVI